MVLDGTTPVQPFDTHRSRAWGDIHGASGLPPRVLALAVEASGGVVLLNMIGHKVACSSHGARLMVNGSLLFTPDDKAIWQGPTMLVRLEDASYQELNAPLRGVRLVNYLTLPRSAHLTHGVQTPPTFPAPAAHEGVSQASTSKAPAMDDDELIETMASAPSLDLTAARPRYIFGNLYDTTPAQRTVQDVMRALRIARYVDLRTRAAGALSNHWTEALWDYGLSHDLIAPLPALGIRAWRVSGNLQAWAEVVQNGLATGWLPRPVERSNQ